MNLNLAALTAGGGEVILNQSDHFSLTTTPGQSGTYRVAQMDDYHDLPRRNFRWKAPLTITLQAACSQPLHAGTWGFGLWNDPFSASLGLGGMSRRLPTLPNCAWFFYASPPNHLEIYEGYPAQGFLAATFLSSRIPPAFLSAGLIGTPLLLVPPVARLLRKAARKVVKQAASQVNIDVRAWHTYQIDWKAQSCAFWVDQQLIYETALSPQGRLGLVIWVDNQYFAFPSSGKLRWGTLVQSQSTTLEIKNLQISILFEPSEGIRS